jgi:pimeloyl-ACP methyl ester carboxylesterase
MSDAYEHHFIQVNGIRLHVVQAGPIDGPVALLLHGFPEFWRGWASQIDALAAAGYRVWVPDQRGYGESDKPVGIDAYGLETLVDDICALIRSTGRDAVTLMGHDWGGVVSWRVAAREPALVSNCSAKSPRCRLAGRLPLLRCGRRGALCRQGAQPQEAGCQLLPEEPRRHRASAT